MFCDDECKRDACYWSGEHKVYSKTKSFGTSSKEYCYPKEMYGYTGLKENSDIATEHNKKLVALNYFNLAKDKGISPVDLILEAYLDNNQSRQNEIIENISKMIINNNFKIEVTLNEGIVSVKKGDKVKTVTKELFLLNFKNFLQKSQ